MRMVQSQDDFAGQQRDEVGKLEDRSKAVISKAISEATKAVEKASTEAQSFTTEVREGSDGKLSSRMSSPIAQVREAYRSVITVYRRGGRVVEDVKANMLRGIMQSTRKVKAMTTTKRVTRMSPRSPRPVTDLRNPIETRRDGRTDVC